MALASNSAMIVSTTSGAANGRRFTRTVTSCESGHPMVEVWLITGAGHAWSGGSGLGSYADALGPDASAEIVKFFLMQNNPD